MPIHTAGKTGLGRAALQLAVVSCLLAPGSAFAITKQEWRDIAKAVTFVALFDPEPDSRLAANATELLICYLVDHGKLGSLVAGGNGSSTDPNYLFGAQPVAFSYTFPPPSPPRSYSPLLQNAVDHLTVAVANNRAYRESERKYNTAVMHGNGVVAAQRQADALGFAAEADSSIGRFAASLIQYADSFAADPSVHLAKGDIFSGVQAVKDSFALHNGIPPFERAAAESVLITPTEERSMTIGTAGATPAGAVAVLGADSLYGYQILRVLAESTLAYVRVPVPPFSVPTGIEETAVPSGGWVAQNVPNPFNPATTIRFGVEAPANVTVVIFAADGSVVRSWDLGVVSAGTHTVVWDGTRDLGARARSGVYFYRVSVNGIAHNRRMVLMR